MEEFLSTPSARRATSTSCGMLFFCLYYFYPRPPRGGRRCACPKPVKLSRSFYPRPPRGGRPSRSCSGTSPGSFLSTPSARRATLAAKRRSNHIFYFYPRPPRGGRPSPIYGSTPRSRFLSTPSARRATLTLCNLILMAAAISIHALREEGDVHVLVAPALLRDFYPRPPRGGRLSSRNTSPRYM